MRKWYEIPEIKFPAAALSGMIFAFDFPSAKMTQKREILIRQLWQVMENDLFRVVPENSDLEITEKSAEFLLKNGNFTGNLPNIPEINVEMIQKSQINPAVIVPNIILELR